MTGRENKCENSFLAKIGKERNIVTEICCIGTKQIQQNIRMAMRHRLLSPTEEKNLDRHQKKALFNIDNNKSSKHRALK